MDSLKLIYGSTKLNIEVSDCFRLTLIVTKKIIKVSLLTLWPWGKQ